MKPSDAANEELLKGVARQAMLERGLLPAQEDSAAKVERQVAKSAAALLLAARIGQSFEAIVTGAAQKGTWVRICAPTAEGRVVKGFEGLDVGDRCRVKLIRTDVRRGFIDFERSR